MSTKRLKKALMAKKRNKGVPRQDFLSSGSTLINMGATGTPHGCFAKGKYHFLVGDSASGKTWLSLTCLAEAAKNPEFDDYRFIYDNAEDGALMDMERFFGKAMVDRVEPPALDEDGEPVYSATIEDLYDHMDDAIKDGRPFIYIVDSMDALSSEDEAAKFDQQKTARAKGTQAAGSYGDGKAKKNSANLRRVVSSISKTKSILVIINQTRDNIGFGFEKKTRSGGHALRFYATLEMWSSKKKTLTRTVKGQKREIGILAVVQVKKNRFTGRLRTVGRQVDQGARVGRVAQPR
jgi:RecA/RadA recombinase